MTINLKFHLILKTFLLLIKIKYGDNENSIEGAFMSSSSMGPLEPIPNPLFSKDIEKDVETDVFALCQKIEEHLKAKDSSKSGIKKGVRLQQNLKRDWVLLKTRPISAELLKSIRNAVILFQKFYGRFPEELRELYEDLLERLPSESKIEKRVLKLMEEKTLFNLGATPLNSTCKYLMYDILSLSKKEQKQLFKTHRTALSYIFNEAIKSLFFFTFN